MWWIEENNIGNIDNEHLCTPQITPSRPSIPLSINAATIQPDPLQLDCEAELEGNYGNQHGAAANDQHCVRVSSPGVCHPHLIHFRPGKAYHRAREPELLLVAANEGDFRPSTLQSYRPDPTGTPSRSAPASSCTDGSGTRSSPASASVESSWPSALVRVRTDSAVAWTYAPARKFVASRIAHAVFASFPTSDSRKTPGLRQFHSHGHLTYHPRPHRPPRQCPDAAIRCFHDWSSTANDGVESSPLNSISYHYCCSNCGDCGGGVDDGGDCCCSDCCPAQLLRNPSLRPLSHSRSLKQPPGV